MKSRNVFLKLLFDTIENQDLPEDEKITRIKKYIDAIFEMASTYKKFKQICPEIKNVSGLDVEDDIHLDMTNANDETPLFVALKVGSSNIVRTLLEAKANPNMGKVYKTPGMAIPQLKKPLLAEAAERGQAEIVTLLLEANANPNAPCEHLGITPLSLAVAKNHPSIVSTLLDAKADPNTATYLGATPLLLAAKDGQSDIAKRLLDARARPDYTRLENGCTPLMIALNNDHNQTVKILLETKADPDDRGLPLAMAMSKSNSENVIALLAAKADPNNYESLKTPLTNALLCLRSKSIVKALLEAKANPNKTHEPKSEIDPNFKGDTPLKIATLMQNIETIKLLLEFKADPNIYSGEGSSPLSMAVMAENLEILRLLLEANANPDQLLTNIVEGEERRITALCMAAQKHSSLIVDLLLEAKAVPDKCEEKQLGTALMNACIHGRSSIVIKLLNAKADPNLMLRTGHRTVRLHPLDYAFGSNNRETVLALLEAKADPTKLVEFKKTCLTRATYNQWHDVVETLIEAKVDVNKHEKETGNTALIWASTHGDDAVAEMLIKQGANLEAMNDAEKTALDQAYEKQHLKTSRLLLKHGASVRNPQKLFAFLQTCDQRDPEVLDSLQFFCVQLTNGISDMKESKAHRAFHKKAETYFGQLQTLTNITRRQVMKFIDGSTGNSKLTPSLLSLIADYDVPLENPRIGFFAYTDIKKLLPKSRLEQAKDWCAKLTKKS